MAVDRTQMEAAATPGPVRRTSAYDQWIQSIGIPVHKGYYQDDLRTVEVGMWEERDCMAAIIQLAGQEGFTEGRVTEIPPGKTLPPTRFALDEIVYSLSGRGLCTIWASDDRPKKTFEWQTHSLFMLPRNYTYQLTNTQGAASARLYHYNSLPIAMHMVPDPSFFFDNPYVDESIVYGGGGEEFYSEAKIQVVEGAARASWQGNFFPDMLAWDKLVPFRGRGAGGLVVGVQYPHSTLHNHMSVFDAMTYKKAHRHGPGVQIIIPGGEGYSIMWPEGQEKIIIPWHEGSTFVPPNNWYHQHFNVGSGPARYLAFHAPAGIQSLITAAVIDDPNRQIEYPDEELFIREKFQAELAKSGLKSIMPDICYQDRDFEWDYGDA